MRPQVARAERALAVRSASRAWRRAGTIDDTALAAIAAAYADDRARARLVFRVLFFVFTAFAVFAAFGLFMVSGFDGTTTYGLVALAFGAALVVLTDIQTGSMRRDRGGTEEATAFTAVVFLMIGAGWLLLDQMRIPGRSGLTLFLVVCAAILAAAAWRWAHLLAAVMAAVCALWVLARLPYGRWLWAIAGVLAIAPLLRASISARVAPSHRRACAAVLGVALLGLYAAVSIYSFDHGIVERIGDRAPGFWRLFSAGAGLETGEPIGGSWSLLRMVQCLLTAFLPLALIVAGIRKRRRILLDAGGVLAALSLVTIRAYWHLADTWIVLSAAGAALIALALVLQRRLDAAPGKERRGFTAEPLFESPAREQALRIAATVVTLAPSARPTPADEPTGFRGKGGASGGAGAGGEF